MSAPSYIRRHINNLADDKPFSIRDFLVYGPRNTVDQVFHRLLQAGRILRVARGIYIKSTASAPTVAEVIRVKVAAFGRTIATHGSEAGLMVADKSRSKQSLTFACSAASSSFRVGHRVVYLIRTSPRKMQLSDSPPGLAIRALWHLGKIACDVETAAALIAPLKQNDKQKLRQSAALMPQWLRDCLAHFFRMDCYKGDLEPLSVS
jgi:hypothetical protein